MKISVITTFYNSGSTIVDTLLSVFSSKFKNVEYILIDSLSTDSSLEIVKKIALTKDNVKIISEKDSGIYDGMNKGIEHATGEIICILNADDFLEEDSLEHVSAIFKANPNLDLFAGSIRMVDEENNRIIELPRTRYSPLKKNSPAIHHPGIFVHRRVYEKIGFFNLKYKISADYEFISRFLDHKLKFIESDKIVTNVRTGGCSDSIRNLIKKHLEHYEIASKYTVSFPSKIILAIKIFKKTTIHFIYLQTSKRSVSGVRKSINELRWFNC